MKQQLTNADIFKVMEAWAPKSLAYDWDNVGLQIGSNNRPVKKVMVTLDVLEEVADEAIANHVDLVIAHHPLLFKSLSRIDTEQPKGRTIQKLLAKNISVYAAHTNLDVAAGGVNDMLFEALQLQDKEVLLPTQAEELYKLAVYVPISHQEDIMHAWAKTDAGHIGAYSHCTFRTQGKGTFKPLEGTNPYIGKQQEISFVDEVRMETIVKKSRLADTIKAMIAAHPYEEVAYDVYPLENKGELMGLGRIGTLEKQMNLKELCEFVKTALSVPAVRVTGDLTKSIKKVAVLGGSGEKYFMDAKRKGADAYITGDVTFHAAQDAEQIGLAVIDPGHHVEKIMTVKTQAYLREKFPDLEIITSNVHTEPFQFM
ncbi:Nif3-like dinuclear metal center hexameric protein [Virgibacillus sp. 179-BFC.A HS]|uniref:GTP cyclohydrolase 1 type 2 homolog n=1 Tax=Tigheibacillus jepli TaxID=3035914 RepID=A0ABU5CI84_9BACI|nr:Nif3-like dinuclear metal center hexameric protein [Virgibacillus sp. 179-BFC.A HS]MDY0405552.1 Nif3-like dinuclear metal center hexameric protein [Virgibacillus sp. 179-BFC.A HS]